MSMSLSLCGRVTSPKAGDQIVPGKDVMVVWEYVDTSSSSQGDTATSSTATTVPQQQQPIVPPETVDIELRDAATGAPVRTIVSKLPNRGYYFWNVDSRMPVGKGRCLFVGSLLRPSVPSVQSAPFDIVAPPSSSSLLPPPAVANNSASSLLAGSKRTAATAAARRRPKPAPWSCSSASSLSSIDCGGGGGAGDDDMAIDRAAQAIRDMSLDDGDAQYISLGGGGDSMPPPSSQRAKRGTSNTMAAVAQHVTLRAKRRRDGGASSSSSSTALSTTAAGSTNGGGVGGGRSTRQQQQRMQVQSTATFPWCDHPAFVYYTANMDTVTVRQSLRSVVKESDITADTMLESGETAGMFCVRYLLMHYYRKRIDNEDPGVASAIRDNSYVPDPMLVQRYSSLLASKSLTVARRIPARAARSVQQSSSSSSSAPFQEKKENQNDKRKVAGIVSGESTAATTSAVRRAQHVVVPPTQITLAPLRLSAPQRRAK